MYNEQTLNRKKRINRAFRVRNGLKLLQPRLTVFRSAGHVYAQIIDDQKKETLVGVGSYDKELRKITGNKEVAKQVGLKLALLAKEKNIQNVVFDRGRYKFHGRIAALAEGAREGGLLF